VSCLKEKYLKYVDCKKLLDYMFDQPCALSFAKGYGVELVFIDQLKSKGCEVKKIRDHDKSKRYDLLAEKTIKKLLLK